MVLAYSSYSKLIMMSLLVKLPRDLKYFGGKLPTVKKKTGKFGLEKNTVVQNLVALPGWVYYLFFNALYHHNTAHKTGV